MLQNRDLDFYKELHCTEVNDDCYYEFNTPNDTPIVFDSVWFKELFEGETGRLIAGRYARVEGSQFLHSLFQLQF